MKAPTTYTYTIPSCLKKGFYLVRHEIIALHASWAYPGAQFYPGCHQLNVTGGGSTVPGSLVSFPGAYKGTDAGITYDAYKGGWLLICFFGMGVAPGVNPFPLPPFLLPHSVISCPLFCPLCWFHPLVGDSQHVLEMHG